MLMNLVPGLIFSKSELEILLLLISGKNYLILLMDFGPARERTWTFPSPGSFIARMGMDVG